ncbi:pyrophosphatase [Aureococcus anophagefferens]|nr:pyrophosphatase [Aureococcus anophagefferens]
MGGSSTNWRAVAENNTEASTLALGGAYPREGNGVIIPFFKFRLARTIAEHKLQNIYDRFVVTRTDQFYPCALDLAALEPSLLWIPYGEDYGGLCDRFLVAPSDLVLQALDIMRPVVSFPDRYFDFVGNPEMLFRRRLAEMRLLRRTARFARSMFTGSGEADHSRWSQVKGCVDDPAPICFKYAGEYEAAMRGCGLDDPRGRVSVPTWSDGFFHNGKWSNSTSDIWGDGDVE